jgi:hypothetical protein
MFAKSKLFRLAIGACLALPFGFGLLQPAEANAWEIVRGGPIVHGAPIVRGGPIVRTGPIVVDPIVWTAPIIRTGPIVVDPIVRVGGPVYHPYRWYR